jgi:hypothetical protein
MAENQKVTLRQAQLYGPIDFKVKPSLIDNILLPSLISGEENRQIASIYYGGEAVSLSNLNSGNQTLIDTINSYRSASPSYTSVLASPDATLEYLPEKHHITEMIQNLERMEEEYPQKLGMLSFLVDNLFDVSYATGIHNFGRGDVVSPVGGIIESSGAFKISGYIIAETTDEDASMNLVIRGVPVPLRKTKTSADTYYFTYPQYLVDTQDSLDSVQHIEVNDSGLGSNYYFGNSHSFLKNSVSTNDNDYTNLQIKNRVERNG